ncbi:hypothetical protein BLNAU_13879 [Blattamonas nauphoetae]|uniref:Uncharacterized protein n=1 Tax=Blattamonas nauphoetae TaxID=2049346 RepID=A0ABQ9XF93_9EUKA|nr:hypothetical protein BLNAU_13879 [Blattamonas nauphoetae]
MLLDEIPFGLVFKDVMSPSIPCTEPRGFGRVRDLQRFLEETTGGEGSGGIILHGPRQSGKTSLILNVLTFLSNNPDHVRSPTHILTRPPVQQRQRRISLPSYLS